MACMGPTNKEQEYGKNHLVKEDKPPLKHIPSLFNKDLATMVNKVTNF